MQVVRVEKDTTMFDESILITAVDYDYLKTYDLELVEGRDLMKYGTDSEEAIIVNEKLLKIYGWGDEAWAKNKLGF